ncbi:hypothetical protein Bca52824_050082 [Brassica carinata]|uniref:Uncharacterized protein n=1 Tax=Brassica carinata TaxID=52824 RepID=A0A8X7RNV1_BRACI|nr:hypothetical protein Bca52824_050082 [Brassica carinata]
MSSKYLTQTNQVLSKIETCNLPAKLSIVRESNICAGFLAHGPSESSASPQAAPRNKSVTTVTTCCSYLFLDGEVEAFQPKEPRYQASRASFEPQSGESICFAAHHTVSSRFVTSNAAERYEKLAPGPLIQQRPKEQSLYQKTTQSPNQEQKKTSKANRPSKDNRKDNTPINTRQKISGSETRVFISANGDHVSLKPSPHHRFTKQRRITKSTVYRDPPYHSGKTPEPRTSSVFIDLEYHRKLPGNLTPTTEESLQRLYWRIWGIKQLQRTRGERHSI